MAAKYKDHMNGLQRGVKRFCDVAFALLALLLSAPFALVIYIMIKVQDHGPAFYSQERTGFRGRPFKMYKFRTMVTASEEEEVPLLCSENDERLTRLGLFLREHHLDEWPQLWNIVKGDMSFVGPRPERQYFIDMIMERNADYVYLYQLRPGIFSKATLYNGYTDTVEKMLTRLEMDLEYLQGRTLWGDLRIIVLTVWSILAGRKF